MVFKLVRTDAEDPCKIELPIGKQVFGRNRFLDCDDKKVSRSHGELDTSENTVILSALHQNPCFYVKKGTETPEVLRQGTSVNLNNGDKFGLLPNSFWYELILCNIPQEKNEKELQSPVNRVDNTTREPGTNSETTIKNCEEQAELNESEILDFQLNETFGNGERPASPSVIPPEPESSNKQSSETEIYTQQEQIGTNNVQSKTTDDAGNSTEEESPGHQVKRQHSEDKSEEVNKKIKVESQDDNGHNNAGDGAGPSNPAAASDNLPMSPVKPANNVQLRERCMYGAQCYRRNPAHKSQFSHPSDSDWGAGARGVCPFGASCVKADPRHWRDHTHPDGTTQPQPQNYRPGKKVKKNAKRRESSSNGSSREVSPAPDINLPAKRTRKPVKLQSFSESESDSERDPFQTDESDEWEPSSSKSQNTQDD